MWRCSSDRQQDFATFLFISACLLNLWHVYHQHNCPDEILRLRSHSYHMAVNKRKWMSIIFVIFRSKISPYVGFKSSVDSQRVDSSKCSNSLFSFYFFSFSLFQPGEPFVWSKPKVYVTLCDVCLVLLNEPHSMYLKVEV